MFPGCLLHLGLLQEENNVGKDCPIRYGVKGKIWVRGGVKEEDDDEEYDEGRQL